MTHNLKTHRLLHKKIGNVNCQQRIGSSLALTQGTLHKIPVIDNILVTVVLKSTAIKVVLLMLNRFTINHWKYEFHFIILMT